MLGKVTKYELDTYIGSRGVKNFREGFGEVRVEYG